MKEIDKNIKIIIEELQQVTKKPEYFIEGNDSLRNKIKTSLKKIYDTTKSEELNISKYGALPELIIKNFDTEQIWQQIELQNDAILSDSLTNISKLITLKDCLIFPNVEDEIKNTQNDIKIATNDGNEISKDLDDEIMKSSSSESDTETNVLDLRDANSEPNNVEKKKNYYKKSTVDDEFFNLDEMENFLKTEEKKIQDGDSKSDSEASLSEMETNINLFESDSDEDDKIKTAKFKDFFVAKDDTKLKQKSILDIDSEDEIDTNSEIKSSLELRQERLKKKIEDIEQNNVSEKPWQFKGEITADNRPQNSLLEEIVEFDLTSRPAPIITEQTTLQLEDIIRQRIKDRVFDSVVRKVKPVETPIEYKKKLVLDQEKSKQSLAQIYEKEFLDQQASLDPESKDREETEPELHKEIKSLMRNLFNKLDSLSNFHFTPKPAIPELRVVNNLPAIAIEEVAPVATSDGALLAPEEVKNKTKGEFIGKTERTTTNKKRERRKKKQKQHAHLREKQKHEKLINKLNPGLGNKYSKEKAKKALQQITKDRNTGKMEESTSYKEIKSSRAFFTRLQEEVQTHIGNKVKTKGTKKQKQFLDAKKIKL